MALRHPSRRDFLRRSGLYAGALWLAGSRVRADDRSPNETLGIALIGTGGRGRDNLRSVSSESIVALCDVDEEHLREPVAQHPKASVYRDFRRMLDERKDIDAVVVSTPDHTHAIATLMALGLGKHVYCEKPLTHSIREARRVAEAAARSGRATQMGNTGHSSENTRRAVEIIRSGVLGPISEVHAWSNRPIWPQGIGRPSDTPEVPASLDWDLWLGPAPERPYHPAYHPFKWRGFWDFGTGALGDMGCHIIDAAFWALELDAPTAVEATSEGMTSESAPLRSEVRYEFPARGDRPSLRLIWHDGGKLPPSDLLEGVTLPERSNGSLFVGTKGNLLLGHGRSFTLLPRQRFEGFQAPEPTLPRSPGHHAEWISACKSGGPTGTHFGYAGPLTELVLLGNVAIRAGRKITWDAARLLADGGSIKDPYIEREYRRGWAI